VSPRFRLLSALVLAAAVVALAACTADSPRRHLLVVVDGLRPDYVTPEVMPRLTALGIRGVVFARHHSVYPTVTRVNAASMSTGAYPETHGLLGNAVYFPKIAATRFLDTSLRENLLKIGESEGRLLTAATLGETLASAGRRMLVVSSGSTGSAFLINHTVSGGAILHPRYTLPASLEERMKALGTPPGDDAAPGLRDQFTVDALLRVGIPRVDPSVTVLWLGELDSTAHGEGVGASATVAMLRKVDSQIGRVEDGLKAAGLFDQYDIWVTSDHGFSTHTGATDISATLAAVARSSNPPPEIAAGSGAIYVRDASDAPVQRIVAALQRTAGIGAIFTRASQPGSFDGQIPGTLSLEAVRWQHERSAPILVSTDWTDAVNDHGMPGAASADGTAGHGSASPWDVHNTLIAAGPDLKRGVVIHWPSGNVDFAPTFLHLLGIAIPGSFQGRVLEEAFTATAVPQSDAARTMEHTARTPDGTYSVTGQFSSVRSGGREFRYFDGARVVRK
jgi:arylsulfatase A-like enzyme